MRRILQKERNKRGCPYCLDYQKRKYGGRLEYACIHDECPYHELDKYDTYRKYLKNEGLTISMKQVFKLLKE